MSIATTEPEKVIAFTMARPAVLDDPGGPNIEMLHSDSDGIFISLPLSYPKISPKEFFQSVFFSLKMDVSSL